MTITQRGYGGNLTISLHIVH